MVAEKRNHLCSATRILDVSSEKYLRDDDKLFVKQLRQYHDVLFLEADDAIGMYQKRLRKMHNLGILNLSFTPIDEKDELHLVLASKRSLVCRLREANKKTKQAIARATKAEKAVAKTKKLLEIARAQVAAFRAEHPEWIPPKKLLLPKAQDEAFNCLFKVCSTCVHVHPPHIELTCIACHVHL